MNKALNPQSAVVSLQRNGIDKATENRLIVIPTKKQVGLKLWRLIDYLVKIKAFKGWVRMDVR